MVKCKKITLIPGDGIGPEIIKQAIKVLDAISKRFKHIFLYTECLAGAVALDKTGVPLPQETLKKCLNSDAVLLGAIGDTRYDNSYLRPEQGLLKLRKEMNLYCNIRTIKVYKELLNNSPLKNIKNVDFVIYRDLIGGIYFGEKGRTDNEKKAYDYCRYSKKEIEHIGITAFEAAIQRKKKLYLVDKANVLETSRLWREVIKKISIFYPEVNLNLMLIDNAAMQIILTPKQFDIIVMENMFGDIISDEASVITGSIGLIPSASIGNNHALFEPVHGSYPQAAGKNIANPLGCIFSVIMMLNFWGLKDEAKIVEEVIKSSFRKKKCTIDICKKNPLSTEHLGDFLAEKILKI